MSAITESVREKATYQQAEIAYKAFCSSLDTETRGHVDPVYRALRASPPMAWEWLTVAERAAWRAATTAARESAE